MKMKNNINIKVFIICIFIIMLINFIGCKDINQADNTKKSNTSTDIIKSNKIAKTKLTNREEEMIKGTGCSKYFVFDVELTDKYKYLEIWIDKYEYGEKIKKIIELRTPLNSQNKSFYRIMLTIHDINNESEKWVLSCMGGSGSIILQEFNKDMSMVWQSANEVNIIEGEENSIAVILQKEGNGISGVPIDFFTNKVQYSKKLEEFNYSFVLKTRFYKENPHDN